MSCEVSRTRNRGRCASRLLGLFCCPRRRGPGSPSTPQFVLWSRPQRGGGSVQLRLVANVSLKSLGKLCSSPRGRTFRATSERRALAAWLLSALLVCEPYMLFRHYITIAYTVNTFLLITVLTSTNISLWAQVQSLQEKRRWPRLPYRGLGPHYRSRLGE